MVSIVVRLADLDFLSPLDLRGELPPAEVAAAIRRQCGDLRRDAALSAELAVFNGERAA